MSVSEMAVPPSDSQSVESAKLLLSQGQTELRKLMDSIKDSQDADPQIAEALQRFQRELESSVQRTINDFTQLPTVARIFEGWNKAGLPPDDITFLLTDVAALLDARSSQSHQDIARLIGMLADAVLSVAHVYTLAFQEAHKARKESAELRVEMRKLREENSLVLKKVNESCVALRANAQASFDLTTALAAHTWRGKLLWAGMCVASMLIGMGIMRIFR